MLRGSRRKAKFCFAVFSIVVILIIYQSRFYIVQRLKKSDVVDFLPTAEYLMKGEFTERPFKTVHLDLKGAPPRLSYLRKLLPVLATSGCNALLVEYEDMFPYNGILANLSARNSYTRQQIKTLLSWAHDLNMEVIPLIQTFGHLEFALKLEEWKHLREISNFPQEVCPSKDDSLELVQEMIRQVMLLHRGVKYLHIGADEVFHLGVCSQCVERSLTSKELYAEYVSKVAEYVHNEYPGVTPIIWDDMIRTTPHLLGSTRLPQLVEPMVWAYSTDVSQLISSHTMYWYSKHFHRIWIAGAFKGAANPTTLLPNLELRYLNQLSWLNLIKNYNKAKIVGFVLTGWSRFDHFAVLCELLPPSIPSLLLNLNLINIACDNKTIDEHSLYNQWRSSMSCPNNIYFTPMSAKTEFYKIITCNFPGVDLYELILNLNEVKREIYKLDEKLTKKQGWLTNYNINKNFTSAAYVKDYRNLYILKALRDITSFRNYTKLILNKYYDKHVIVEWMEQNIEPLYQTLRHFDLVTSKLLYRTVWPRRPLN